MTNLLFFTLALTLLWLVFKLLLSNLNFLKTNRVFLLVIPVLPFGIYYLSNLFVLSENVESSVFQVTLNEITVSAAQPIINSGLTWMEILVITYFIGVLTSLATTLSGYIKVFHAIGKLNFTTGENDTKIAFSEEKKSYSFFKYIHISTDLKDNPQVLQHEMIHVSQGHSWDVLLYNFYRIIFWFHPVIYLLDNEIKLVHEYLADEKVGSTSGKNNYANSLLNIYFGTGSIQFINQFNNQKFLKMRLKMLSKNQKKSQVWRYAVVPVLLVVLTVTVSSFKSNIKINNSIEISVSDPIYDSVDVMPEFKGGKSELFSFIGKSVKYPKNSANEGVEGKCLVEFTITSTGKVKDAKILKGVNDEIDAESLRVINAMPAWTPGIKDGKNVNVKMVLPIVYKLSD